ncbi:MAG: glycosyltransferase family 39 protein [Acidimicrobiales bacterium]
MRLATKPGSAAVSVEEAPPSSGLGNPHTGWELTGVWRAGAVAGVVAVVVAGIVLRFTTHSALWLDEALSVDIAKRPLSQLHALLRQDGAPPLYYVALHLWMRAFGTSNLAVRSLSGVMAVLTLPVVWAIGRNYGTRIATALLVLAASAPFAIYYGTEARMYALVMLLSALGYLALLRSVARPSVASLVGLAVTTAALLYTQYWAIYLVATLAVWLLFVGRKSQRDPLRKRGSRASFAALVLGCLAFVPWLPTFLFQARHTGTPWAAPGNFGAIVSAITGFTDNQATLSTAGSNQGRVLAILYLLLAFLAVFGVATNRWHIDLDLKTRPRTRSVAFVVFGTLVVAVGGGLLTKSGYSNRYASIIFIPFLALVALGLLTLHEPKLRATVLLVAALAGLAVGVENINTQRTQAPSVAAVLRAHAAPGDIVAFCPDQLGPSVWRLTSGNGYHEITYPRSASPAVIDWIAYKGAIEASSPSAFVGELRALAGTRSIWLVWTPGYQGYGTRCETIASSLLSSPGYGGHQWLTERPSRYYEPMNLTQFKKVVSAPSSAVGSASH